MPITIDIKVIPRARAQKIQQDATYTLRCHVKSPPEDNKANQELIQLLAKELGIPKRDISIVTGATSRIKRLHIASITSVQELYKRLNFEVQHALF